MRAWFPLMFFISITLSGYAREYELDIEMPSLDAIYDLGESGDLDEDSVAELAALLMNPLDLNSADGERLYALPGVSRALAAAILARRERLGHFRGVDELLQVPGMSRKTLVRLRPFVSVTPVSFFDRMNHSVSASSLWRRGYGGGADETHGEPQGYAGWHSRYAGRFEGGGLMTYRETAAARYDPAWGQLVSHGATHRARLESFYFVTRQSRWSAVFGNYAVGFGERLVFDNTTQRTPDGWSVETNAQMDFERAEVRPHRTLFGAAVTATGLLHTTIFVSRKRHAVYQYDLRSRADDWLAPVLGECDTAGRQRRDFICGDDGFWYSSDIHDIDSASGESHRYLTIEDAFSESLLGAHVAWRGLAATRLGLTGYTSRVSFAPELGDVHFAPSARYPDRERLAALGVDFHYRRQASTLAAEYARSQDGGDAFYAHWMTQPMEALALTVALRRYSPWFENPHNRGEAAPDEALGLAQRNEKGARFEALLRPWRGLRLFGNVDVWQIPYRQNGSGWVRFDEPPLNVRLSQRISVNLSRHETIGFSSEYRDKDLARGGRDEFYDGEDAAGERRKFGLSMSSDRYSSVSVVTDYSVILQDTNALSDRFAREDRMRLRASVRLPSQIEINTLVGLRRHSASDAAAAFNDQQPATRAYVEITRPFSRHTRMRLRYGNVRYGGARPDRYAYYHLLRVAWEGEF